MPKVKLEDFLLPWEVDKDGKKLDEAREIDVEKLRKYIYGLLGDKEQAQEARDTAITERDEKDTALKEVQQQHENDEQRRTREEAERQKEIDDLRKSDLQRKKIEALEDAFPDATSARIKKLAKRVTGDEKDWVNDAKELVEDGFKITETKTGDEGLGDSVETGNDLSVKPVRRSDGRPVQTTEEKVKARSVADELDAAGIGRSGW